jgi:hypothetical protein
LRLGPGKAADGTRPRVSGQNHSGGKKAAGDLRELLNLKDKAQYGFLKMSVPEVRKVMRRANGLVEFAAGVLSR